MIMTDAPAVPPEDERDLSPEETEQLLFELVSKEMFIGDEDRGHQDPASRAG